MSTHRDTSTVLAKIDKMFFFMQKYSAPIYIMQIYFARNQMAFAEDPSA